LLATSATHNFFKWPLYTEATRWNYFTEFATTFLFKKKKHCPAPIPSIFGGFLPQWFTSTPVTPPESKEFSTNDCIWYYGTLYVKEAVAVARMQEQQQMQQQMQQQTQQPMQQPMQQQMHQQIQEPNHCIDVFDDDDTESISSGNGSISAFKHPRNIGKQNQLKYLKDGMRLRHMILLNRANHEWNEWFATFDAETNRIIRTSDGVAFDTLRQFARLHCNEVLSIDSSSTNVWSDPHFQYQDADGQWHPLSNLKH
jgi:hypothetical protein